METVACRGRRSPVALACDGCEAGTRVRVFYIWCLFTRVQYVNRSKTFLPFVCERLSPAPYGQDVSTRSAESERRCVRRKKSKRARVATHARILAGAALLCAQVARAERGAPAARVADVTVAAGVQASASEVQYQVHDWAYAKSLMDENLPALSVAEAGVASAEAQVNASQGALLPRVQLSAGAVFNPIRPRYNSSYALDGHQYLAIQSLQPMVAATAVWTLSLQALRDYRSEVAGLQAQQLTLDARRHELLLSLASALLDVVAAQRFTDRTRAGLQAAEKRLAMTRRMVELGRATKLDENRFVQDLHEVQQDLVSSEQSLWQARESLGSALGVNAPVGVFERFSFETLLGDPNVSGCEELSSTLDRADLQAAAERAKQAELAVDAVELSYLPELRLENSYQGVYADTEAITFGGGRTLLHTWSSSASLVWTLFDGTRAAELDRRKAALDQVRTEYRSLALAAESEHREAVRLVDSAQRKLEIAEDDMQAAKVADNLARRSFELGTVSALEGVDAAKRLRAAEITLALREVELVYARLRARMSQAQCK